MLHRHNRPSNTNGFISFFMADLLGYLLAVGGSSAAKSFAAPPKFFIAFYWTLVKAAERRRFFCLARYTDVLPKMGGH